MLPNLVFYVILTQEVVTLKKSIEFDTSKKIFPTVTLLLGIIIAVVQLITRQNLVTLVSALFCAIMSAIILLSMIFKKKIYLNMLLGYLASLSGNMIFHIIWGADAGFGAFTSAATGWQTAEHPLMAAYGGFFTRLLGNILLAAPQLVLIASLILIAKKAFKKEAIKKLSSGAVSLILVGASVFYIFTMNMRTKPVTEKLWEGHDDYLSGIDNNSQSKPNVLVILMDDLGWGDISLNGAIYDTPSIDSIGENGLSFENFYSSYSVCSPARFAALTGRYPYRGYADNVIYPTVNCFSPFAQTRVYNSFEMQNNADGMLGDEITLAEVFKNAGYSTGCFGKWHLGDYGEYLPTNQGFDYFYGSHHVNDMKPFYHVKEENGEYEIVHGAGELKDQKDATKYIHKEISSWITDKVTDSDEPFFAFYTSPWPHAPIYVGDEFKGKTGMGNYADCVTEFDYYLGELFNTMEDLGVLDDTLIIFTSDNGPALEGSTGLLRGGKYLAYEGGQKVPFMMRWDNGNLFKGGEKRNQSATLVDLFPTLIDLCSITDKNGNKSYLPSDREIDGVSMMSLIENDSVIHNDKNPILYMKRRKLKAIQYTVPTKDILAMDEYKNYKYPVLINNPFITFKYFKNIQNDNSAFFDKFRKNWLHILTDDIGENYNRTPVYPSVSADMKAQLESIQKDFEENPRGTVN